MEFDFDRVENIVRKEGNTGYKHCLLLAQCFQKASYLSHGLLKSWDYLVKGLTRFLITGNMICGLPVSLMLHIIIYFHTN